MNFFILVINVKLLLLVLLATVPAAASNYTVSKYDFGIKPETTAGKIRIQDAVQMVLRNNTTVNNSKLEIIKSRLPLLKHHSQYAFRAWAQAQAFQAKMPPNGNNFISGNKIYRNEYSIGVDRKFSTGTYINLQAGTDRMDSNAFEGQGVPAPFSYLAMPPQYSGRIRMSVSQELIRNMFGLSEKNRYKIIKINSLILTDSLISQLTGLVADTLVKYWTLQVQKSSIEMLGQLLENSRQIRNLTVRKSRIGTAENFELHRWNSVIASLESQLENAKMEYRKSIMDLARILNTSPDIEVEGLTDLATKLPDLDVEKDTEYAWQHRLDLKILGNRKKMNQLLAANAEMESSPSLKVFLSYTSLAQNLNSPGNNYSSAGVLSGKYPDIQGSILFTWPLGNPAAETNKRDAESSLEEIKTLTELRKKEIKDEIRQRYIKLTNNHQNFLNKTAILDESRKGYLAIRNRYISGKAGSEQLKNALDNLARAELGKLQSKIGYNVDLLLYDLSKNYLLERYGINIYSLLQHDIK